MTLYRRDLSKSLHKKRRNDFKKEDIVNNDENDDDATNAYHSIHKTSGLKRQLQNLMNLIGLFIIDGY